MRVISVIEDEEIIKKILKHLGLWDRKARPPPKATRPPKVQEYSIDFSDSQLPCLPDVAYDEGGSDEWPPYQVRGRFMLTLSILRSSLPDF